MKGLAGLTDINQMRGLELCLSCHNYLSGLAPSQFDELIKTPLGGAVAFIANQYAERCDKQLFYMGVHDNG